jgi:hypothetical protein
MGRLLVVLCVCVVYGEEAFYSKYSVHAILKKGPGKLLLERMDCAKVSRVSVDGILTRLRAGRS